MLKPQGRQLAGFLLQGLDPGVQHHSVAPCQPGALKGGGVELGHLAPDHAPSQQIRLLTHGMPSHVIDQQTGQCFGNGLTVAKGNQHAPSVSKQLFGVPVGSGNHRLATPEGIGKSSRGDLIAVEIGGDIDICNSQKILQFFSTHKAVVKDHLLSHP